MLIWRTSAKSLSWRPPGPFMSCVFAVVIVSTMCLILCARVRTSCRGDSISLFKIWASAATGVKLMALSIGRDTSCRRSHENPSTPSSVSSLDLTAPIRAFQSKGESTRLKTTWRKTWPPQMAFSSGAWRYRRRAVNGPLRKAREMSARNDDCRAGRPDALARSL